ncbi:MULTISPECIES: winged helix-turn-helix domain-containing protein [Serratia]|jgi:DNA-binding winged helix-turn-helix (wHTH) protein|uniref:winged helix-turn-helix domain-containing protein n=1 Tax=Serratia TaxID=613 RepID=UPI0004100713|nr:MULTISPECIES: winged helix-turn-helix domain-containing protein [Serratia]AYM89249.1 CadC family transcriptional regulator [Serratia sp. 3ACOL1]CAI1837061.1 DNA-binding transcriptional activator CadC [Serratia fonticola]CAI1859834.1 DNA-binding transcriptional activator CadC [Serratia fonticola]
MIYIIENRVLFNMDENAFTLLEDGNEKIIISNPARRVLALLIEQHGSIVLRETLFQKVWDDYGLISSNNNLNQCISKLRKIISSLGIESEFIVTIPKIGFLIKKETKVQVYLESEKQEILDEKPLIHDDKSHETVLLKEKPTPVVDINNKNNIKKSVVVYLFLALSFCLISFFVILSYDKKPMQLNHFVANFGECKLYSVTPITKSENEKFIARAKCFMADKNMVCKSNDAFIFHTESTLSPINTGSFREFMARCEVGKDNRIESCQSFYRNDRKCNE